MKSTKEIKQELNISLAYSVFEPWLKANGFTIEDLPLTATNEDGEEVIIEAYKDDDGTVWKISTLQSNGWTRINHYHKDGTIEELYSR